MQQIKYKRTALCIPFLIAGGFGALLRGYELAKRFDPETRMFLEFKGSWILPALCCVTFALSVLIMFLRGGKQKLLAELSPIRSQNAFTLSVIGCFAFALSGTVQFFDAFHDRDFGSVMFSFLTIAAAIALFLLLCGRKCGMFTEAARMLASVPVFWGCILVVLMYMSSPSEPVRRIYIYDLLAVCSLLGMLYYHCGAVFSHKRRGTGDMIYLFGIFIISTAIGGHFTAWLFSRNFNWISDYKFLVSTVISVLLYLLPVISDELNAVSYRKEMPINNNNINA